MLADFSNMTLNKPNAGRVRGDTTTRVNAHEAKSRGAQATELVAAGGADLAVMPVSEILHASGVEFAGSLPPEIQFVQVFSAAVVAGTKAIESSKRLIEFLASARASEAIRKSGMEPLVAATGHPGRE